MRKMMNQVRNCMLVLLLISASCVNLIAQTDPQTSESPSKVVGLDAIFIQKYDVKLRQGTARKPIRTKLLNVVLEANIKYRFIILSAEAQQTSPVLQLFDRRTLMKSTHDSDLQVNGNAYFEFVSEEEQEYQMLVFSDNGKAFQTTALLSMVLEDSTTRFDSRIGQFGGQRIETLYVGVPNTLDIFASDVPNGRLEVTISEGQIRDENGTYTASFQKPGYVNVKVRSFKEDGAFQEEEVIPFLVKPLPPPFFNLSGFNPGFLPRDNWRQLKEVQLTTVGGVDPEDYQIVEFTIGNDQFDYKGYRSRSQFLTGQQLNYLRGLQSGEVFFVKHVVLRDPKGAMIYLDAAKFIMN